jgi:hypothetical protein
MRYLTILIVPAILLIAGCIAIGAGWMYCIFCWLAGIGIGTLAVFTVFQINERKSNTKIKMKER